MISIFDVSASIVLSILYEKVGFRSIVEVRINYRDVLRRHSGGGGGVVPNRQPRGFCSGVPNNLPVAFY
jgi:hypothetical protein